MLTMVDMALSPAEVKAETAPAPEAARPNVPRYPYGLCISLEREQLEKLGLEGGLPEVGTTIEFHATAKVTSASEREQIGPNGEKSVDCRVELQITQMAVPSPDPAEREQEARADRRRRFYGTGKAAEASNEGA